ncbi:MAG: hypothetical protein ACYS22_00150 [Planctomycetota bacterium]|jgi:hypothetical protein
MPAPRTSLPSLAWRRPERGSTLMTIVLLLSFVFAGIATVSSVLTFRQSQGQGGIALDLQADYACESVAELLRAELLKDFYDRSLTTASYRAGDWFVDLRDDTAYKPQRDAAGEIIGAGNARTYLGFTDTVAYISEISPPGSRLKWIEIEGARVDRDGALDQHCRIRVTFGKGDIFDNAMLTERAGCMFCHLKVQGDVTAIGSLVPGFWAENSALGSSVDGSVFISGSYVRPGTGEYADTLNGLEVTGDVVLNYEGPKLPPDRNGDGRPDFPTVSPAAARAEAAGTASAPGHFVTPLGQTFNPAMDAVTSGPSTNTVEGNLVLIGTEDDPIRIDGSLFVSGDVVVRGYVEGQGQIYAGRNLFVAGDVRYKNPPRTEEDGKTPDEVAREEVVAGLADELRLAANGNVVIGNYTYQPGADLGEGGLTGHIPFKYRQGHDFLSSQFQLTRAFHFVPFDPETQTPSFEVYQADGRFFDSEGSPVSLSRVLTLDGSFRSQFEQQNAKYDALFAPGQLQADGTFERWMTDEQYRAVLGTTEYQDFRWLADMSRLYGQGDASKELSESLGASAAATFLADDPGTRAIEAYQGPSGGSTGLFYDKTNDSFMRVVEDRYTQLPTQVEHIDAYVYSSGRIGGRTNWGINIFGGLAAREVGVLAPGNWSFSEWEFQDAQRGDIDWWHDHKPLKDGRRNTLGEAMTGLSLRYDFRLRNGGLGFDLIDRSFGERILFECDPR